MSHVFTPVVRQSLADDLARRIRRMIEVSVLQPGDRLPSIAEMARRFGVGAPALREALRKLETLGVLDIRHGSGVYVGKNLNNLLFSNPGFVGSVSKKLLVDLLEARIPIELESVSLAAVHASEDHLREMRGLLEHADEHLDDDDVLNSTNMAFHRQIALASGNTVFAQLLEVLSSIFQQEQRLILGIFGSRRKDHVEHVGILEALERRAPDVAAQRMRAHLEGVRDVLLQWDPNATTAR